MSNRSAASGERGPVGGVKQNRRVLMSTLLKGGEKNVSIYSGSVFCVTIEHRFVTRRTKKSVVAPCGLE